jgi:hypothetical protein
MTASKSAKADDEVFAKAKKKIGDMIEKAEKVDDVVSLCNTLAKMKQAEKASSDNGDWGEGLTS